MNSLIQLRLCRLPFTQYKTMRLVRNTSVKKLWKYVLIVKASMLLSAKLYSLHWRVFIIHLLRFYTCLASGPRQGGNAPGRHFWWKEGIASNNRRTRRGVGSGRPPCFQKFQANFFFRASASCSKLLNDKKYIQYSEKLPGQLCFSGQAQVAQEP